MMTSASTPLSFHGEASYSGSDGVRSYLSQRRSQLASMRELRAQQEAAAVMREQFAQLEARQAELRHMLVDGFCSPQPPGGRVNEHLRFE